MPLDPTERNVNPLLFQTGIRTVKKLILTLAIHNKNVTMTKPARANFTVRTGLALPFERRMRPKTHRNNELRSPNPLSKQRLIIAVPANTRVPSPIKVQLHSRWHFSPSAHQGFIRGAIALTLNSSGQHRSPVCDPIAGPRPCEYEQEHEEPQGTAHAVRYDPFQTQSTAPVSNGSTHLSHIPPTFWKNQTPDFSVFVLTFHPIFIRMSLPGPGSTGVTNGVRGRNPTTAHLPSISCSWEILKLRL